MSMNYDITPQRQAYIDARGYTIGTVVKRIKLYNELIANVI